MNRTFSLLSVGASLCWAIGANAQLALDSANRLPHSPFAPASHGTFAYDNTDLNGNLFTSGLNPSFVLDDVALDTTGPVLLTGLNFGFYTYGANTDPTTAIVTIWDDIGDSQTPITQNALGSFTVALPLAASGAETGVLDLDGLNIVSQDDFIGVSIMFVKTANPSARSTNTSIIFNDGPPLTGFSEDVYWRDVNGNGEFSAGEARFFNGPPFTANFYLSIKAVPEPGTVALLAAGGLCLGGGWLRRRRS